MLKVVHPYKREVTSEDSLAFRAPCMCSIPRDDYEITRDIGPGCWCSCVNNENRQANNNTARDY